MPSAGEKKPKEIVIHIDHTEYKVDVTEMTGTGLRALPDPAIGPEFDLWLEVPGGEDDRVENDEDINLKNGIHFFTAPSTINPGRAH